MKQMPGGRGRIPFNPQLHVRFHNGRVELLTSRIAVWGDSILLIFAVALVGTAAYFSRNSNLLVFVMVVFWGCIIFCLQLISSLTPILAYDPSTRLVSTYHFAYWFWPEEQKYNGPPKFSVTPEMTRREQEIWVLSVELKEGSMDLARAAHYEPLDLLAQQFLEEIRDFNPPSDPDAPV